ncbi:MAG: glycoside hydrolase family 3 C-terminal domain-containing protein [Acidobacteriia bacterium]|nr:glycoside hydrolase family 3 C-terminal domain-containing protein [Terriglobia bacterium]
MTYPYLEPDRPVAERVKDLLSRMTFEEKTAQMHALWLILSEDGRHRPRQDDFTGGTDPEAVKRTLGHGLGQITRPLGTHGVDVRRGVRALNSLQKFLREETRLGIPALAHEECLVGLMARGATLFPSALAYSATWNPGLIERTAQAIGREARSVGCHQGLAPVFDVSRDVRWGRTEETMGEDPYLVGVLGTHFVRGLQGEKRDLLATLKHYAGHSFSEGARNHGPVHLGWRELNDVFLLPFEMAVKLAHAGAVMPAYHDLDNEPCHASRHLLSEVLRGEWGFDGLIVADYIGVSLLYQHHNIAKDPAEAAAIAFSAGLDIELPADDCASHLGEAVGRGLISMETIDEIVRRILTEKMRMGLFEKPYVDESAIALQTPDAVELAREVARQSVVILENRGVLPLDLQGSQRIAVIGPTANDPLALLCGYSFPAHLILTEAGESASQVVTPKAALEEAFGAERISYAKGCHIIEERKYGSPVFPGDVEKSTTLMQTSQVSRRVDLIPPAVECAKAADVAVVCVGDLSGLFNTGTVGEGSDADSLDLPGVQQQLLDAVVATGKPVVVVLTSGRPYNLGGLEDKVAAFVMAFAGGQEGGTALVDVLTGKVEPSGRLTVSVPKNVGALPYYYNHKMKSAGTPIALHFGSRYPFGHGLAYTQFEFADLMLDANEVDAHSGEIRLRFTVRNIGSRAGVAVPQLYVRDLLASVVRPVKELKAFGRVELPAGHSARVTFRAPSDMLCFTGMEGRRIVEPGEFELQVGTSSADIRLRATVNVTGTVHTLGREWRMESRCEVES